MKPDRSYTKLHYWLLHLAYHEVLDCFVENVENNECPAIAVEDLDDDEVFHSIACGGFRWSKSPQGSAYWLVQAHDAAREWGEDEGWLHVS